jgi:hypothetical protein
MCAFSEFRLWFKENCVAWIQSQSISNYLKSVEALIDAESKHWRRFCILHSTEAKLASCLYDTMIQDHVHHLATACPSMFQLDQIEDLHRMFCLFKRTSNDALSTMSPEMRTHIEILSTQWICSDDLDLNSKEAHMLFIRHVVNLHKKYADMVIQQFYSAPQFVKAFEEAFVTILNKDYKTVTNLATYCDSLLKGEGKVSDEELEMLLDQSAKIVKYVHDKDIFMETYGDLLAMRYCVSFVVSSLTLIHCFSISL